MITNVQIIDKIGLEILHLRYIYTTDKLLAQDADSALSCWSDYADHYDRIIDYFTPSSIFENPFINKIHFRKFCKEYLKFIDQSVDYAIHLSKQEIADAENSILNKYESITSDYLVQIKNAENNSTDIAPLLIDFQNIVKNRFDEVSEFHQIRLNDLRQPFYNTLHLFLDRFYTILSKCESPLESAFFIGLIAYQPFGDTWILDKRFDNQVNIGGYRLDFAYIDKEKNIYINIELDGHNYHERSEEQAVSDRNRDIKLQELGWFVLRFHRREVEESLEGCISRVKKFYELKVDNVKGFRG